MKYEDIPKFPHANYKVNIPFNQIERWISENEKHFDVQIQPDFQRGYVWSEFQQTSYLEFLLREGRSGKDILWNVTNWMNGNEGKEMVLVDGQQRLGAVRKFMRNELKVFGFLKNEFEGKFPILQYDLVFHVNNPKTKKEVIEWYLALNTGGSIHTKEDLKPAYDILKTLK